MNAVIVIAAAAAMVFVLACGDTDRRAARTDVAARQRLLTELERADRR